MMIIELWDLSLNQKIFIESSRIVAFWETPSSRGSNIKTDYAGTLWVQESVEEIKKKLAG